MTDVAPSPRPPRLASASWLDKRLVFGVLLVLSSVLLGAKVLASADTSQQVWSATHDLAAGTVLAEDDLAPSRVRLFGTSTRYVAGEKPIGYVVQRAVSGHELLPVDALAQAGKEIPRREVTVSVLSGHLPPDLSRGEQVDLYVTPDDKGIARALASHRPADALAHLVLGGLTVADVTRAGGLGATGQDQPVVLSVAPSQVLTLVQALSEGQIDLVRVPRTQQVPVVTATESP